MNVDYIQHYGDDLVTVNAARVSMDKESDWKIDDVIERSQDGNTYSYKLCERDVKLIHYLAKHQHYTPFEHCGVTLRLKVPLFVTAQIQRHRTFSFNQISRRYVKDNLEFYWPDKWRKAAENVKQGSSSDAVVSMVTKEKGYVTTPQTMALAAARHSLFAYEELLYGGVCPEQARMILPQNLYTTFYMTGNLRNWAHFLKLRLDAHAQKEVRDVAEMCAKIIEPLFPVSYKALME